MMGRAAKIGFALLATGVAIVAIDFVTTGIFLHRDPSVLSAIGILCEVGFVICMVVEGVTEKDER